MDKYWIVYILRCEDNSFYVGATNNLPHSLKEHQSKRSAQYLHGKIPFALVHNEVFDTQAAALRREKKIKSWTKKQKETMLKERYRFLFGKEHMLDFKSIARNL